MLAGDCRLKRYLHNKALTINNINADYVYIRHKQEAIFCFIESNSLARLKIYILGMLYPAALDIMQSPLAQLSICAEETSELLKD